MPAYLSLRTTINQSPSPHHTTPPTPALHPHHWPYSNQPNPSKREEVTSPFPPPHRLRSIPPGPLASSLLLHQQLLKIRSRPQLSGSPFTHQIPQHTARPDYDTGEYLVHVAVGWELCGVRVRMRMRRQQPMAAGRSDVDRAVGMQILADGRGRESGLLSEGCEDTCREAHGWGHVVVGRLSDRGKLN